MAQASDLGRGEIEAGSDPTLACGALMEIPPVTILTIDRGQSGYQVWATQRGLNVVLDPDISEDGEFRNQTELAVRRFQQYVGLVDDGRFGPKSSSRLARMLEDEVSDSLPHGLLRGIVAGESGELIAAVNWAVAGGVDVGYCQRRVYQADLENETVVKRAFDGLYQMKLLGNTLSNWHQIYLGRPGAKTHQKAWRLAALRHNYPYASDQYAAGKWPSSYALSEQQWVKNIGAQFPDGTKVETPHNWARYYALGASEHDWPGTVTRFVTDWTP